LTCINCGLSTTNKPMPKFKKRPKDIAPIAVARRKFGQWVLHENEEVYYAVVQCRRFGAYRWNSKLNVRIIGAGEPRGSVPKSPAVARFSLPYSDPA
jgi:hypothetical protein